MSQDGIDSVVGKSGLFMCRIASLFLLQRLKGSMSGDARDFNNIETRDVIKFFFLQGKTPKEIHVILRETLGEHAPSYATVKNWVAQFKHGDFSTCHGHLQPRRNWLIWASSVLITHPILRIWPRRSTTCSLDWKNNWKFAIFRATPWSLLPRRPAWMDNLPNFFWLACKC